MFLFKYLFCQQMTGSIDYTEMVVLRPVLLSRPDTKAILRPVLFLRPDRKMCARDGSQKDLLAMGKIGSQIESK